MTLLIDLREAIDTWNKTGQPEFSLDLLIRARNRIDVLERREAKSAYRLTIQDWYDSE